MKRNAVIAGVALAILLIAKALTGTEKATEISTETQTSTNSTTPEPIVATGTINVVE